MQEGIHSSNQPDAKILDRLSIAQYACLALTGLISGIVLCGWLVPVIGSALPGGWSMMKANTALAMLFGAVSLVLTRSRRSDRYGLGILALASIILVLAGGAFFEHLSGRTLGLDTLLAHDTGASMPGRMSIQTACFLLALGLLLIFERSYQGLAHFLDALTMALILAVIIMSAGYFFVAPHLVGQTAATRTSPQTLVCMVLLTFTEAAFRTRDGFLSIFVGVGVGSQSLRKFLPIILLASFLLAACGYYPMMWGWVGMSYAAALVAAFTSFMLIVLNIASARMINNLERALRDMSLTDPLTKLQNRRGFYLLGDQALLVAQRTQIPLTVLFVDVDGLKTVNDTLGHDIGSQLLVDVADLLRVNFRTSDVVARVGGDEFAIAVYGSQPDLTPTLKRLDDATTNVNNTGKNPYWISYTVGEARSDTEQDESFSELVNRADAVMYQRKRLKKSSRQSNSAHI